MSESISNLAERAVNGAPEQDNDDNQAAVKALFKVFHGCYGNLFLAKFATGELDKKTGEDVGVLNARRMWSRRLSAFSADTVRAAVHGCEKAHPEFPPSLQQFAALCEANRPREVFRPDNAIGMSQELRSEYAARARAVLAKHHARAAGKEDPDPPEPGLGPLKRAIANAVATAGGDEAATLLRLDREFERRVP